MMCLVLKRQAAEQCEEVQRVQLFRIQFQGGLEAYICSLLLLYCVDYMDIGHENIRTDRRFRKL